jgi:SAM-dependent methyltransferase
MIEYSLLNLGCGQRFHIDWTNVDFFSNGKDVVAANLLKGIPFSDSSFDVVYHSHLLEHIPKEHSFVFIKECYRVLKPGGILRVVVPDLENMVKEYLRVLNSIDLSKDIQDIEEANYEWIMIEILDQLVRIKPGGEMAIFLSQKQLSNEPYIFSRVGDEMKELHDRLVGNSNMEQYKIQGKRRSRNEITIKRVLNRIKKSIPIKEYQIGRFRLNGEVHQWMYDRYSLNKLLMVSGFVNIEILNAFKSNIRNWNEYGLDSKNGIIHKPNSLFMESYKPFIG